MAANLDGKIGLMPGGVPSARDAAWTKLGLWGGSTGDQAGLSVADSDAGDVSTVELEVITFDPVGKDDAVLGHEGLHYQLIALG